MTSLWNSRVLLNLQKCVFGDSPFSVTNGQNAQKGRFSGITAQYNSMNLRHFLWFRKNTCSL